MNSVLKAAVVVTLGFGLLSHAQAQTTNDPSVEALRNTLVNVLEALVQKGVLTREQAQNLVADAQAKADAAAKATAAQEEAEKNAVIVTRIPESVKQDIVKQVGKDVRPLVTQDVLAEAKSKQWGVPGALPAWLNTVKLFGDVRVREQRDDFASGNLPGTYLDYLTINGKGGISNAGSDAFLNTTEDRLRTRLRMRVGLEAKVADGMSAQVRLATGNTSDPVSTNQTLGQYGARFQLGVDQAFLKYDAGSNKALPWLTVLAGRMPSPYFSTDLVFDPDLNFDGVAITARGKLGGDAATSSHLFFTLGAHPLQEIELASKDKWLYGAQLGLDWLWSQGGRIRVGAAYYYYDNITGKSNAQNGASESHLLDYTAPKWLQKGNTLFDISNPPVDKPANLFALAAKYHLADLTLSVDIPMFAHKLFLSGDYVRNLGYNTQEVLAQPGLSFSGEAATYGKKRVTGYQAEIGFGSPQTGPRGSWRSYLTYRYLERDAVLDAFTDSDFHLGGTDAKGYTLRGEWWFLDRTSLALRYLSSDAIDGAPLGIDTFMLDVSAQF